MISIDFFHNESLQTALLFDIRETFFMDPRVMSKRDTIGGSPPVSSDATERTLAFPLLRAKPSCAQSDVEFPVACSDEELLQNVRRDESFLLVLFQRFNKLAYSIGYRILRDEGEAQDLVQEIFLRLFTEENSFDSSKGSAKTWMTHMIYCRAFDRRGYLRRRYHYAGIDHEELSNALVGHESLENDMIERLTAQQLREAFSQLNDKQRQTLEMFFVEGLKLSEIAERTGQEVSNVRHYYYRGLERLRQLARQMMRNGSVSHEK